MTVQHAVKRSSSVTIQAVVSQQHGSVMVSITAKTGLMKQTAVSDIHVYLSLANGCLSIRRQNGKWKVKAKFHYAILVADRSEAGRRPAASWNLAHHLAGQQRSSTSQQVCDRSVTSLSLRPVCNHDSVMEFGLDQLWTGLRPGSSRFELSRCRDSSNLHEPGRRPVRSQIPLHYLGRRQVRGWSQTDPKLVADLLACASLLLASYMICQIPAPARCRSATSFGPVCDQIA